VVAAHSLWVESAVKPVVEYTGLSGHLVHVEPLFEGAGRCVRMGGGSSGTTDKTTLVIVSFVVYFVTPILLLLLLWALFMSIRCSLPMYPLPVVCEAWPDGWVPSEPGTTWRQKIDCCDGQKVNIPIPFGASPHALVALHWFEGGQRFISYERLGHAASLGGMLFARRSVTFAVPWNLVGVGGCMPKPERSCQYGRTPYIEMAAVNVQCSAADGQCHAPIRWSWGELSFTIPRHTQHERTVSQEEMHTVVYVASFPHEFNEAVPPTLPTRPPHFPLELTGVAGPSANRPTERYPTPYSAQALHMTADLAPAVWPSGVHWLALGCLCVAMTSAAGRALMRAGFSGVHLL
jgi:hypothetical protein